MWSVQFTLYPNLLDPNERRKPYSILCDLDVRRCSEQCIICVRSPWYFRIVLPHLTFFSVRWTKDVLDKYRGALKWNFTTHEVDII